MNTLYKTHWGTVIRHSTDESNAHWEMICQVESADKSNKSRPCVQNACGIIMTIESGSRLQPMWKKRRTLFGTVFKAYTTAGNFLWQNGKFVFKGASCPALTLDICSECVSPDARPLLQLVVMSVGLSRTLITTGDCVLENILQNYPFVRQNTRCEELCNVVVFYIDDWEALLRAMDSECGLQPPKTVAVTVTNKGTLTARMTWDAMEWTTNRDLVRAMEVLREFVRTLI